MLASLSKYLLLIFFDCVNIDLGGVMWFLFSKFKFRKWKKYPYEKRFRILKALEEKIAKSLKIKPLKLELKYDTDWNCFGAFTVENGKRKMILNSNLIEDTRFRFHAMETIAHETRHAYQHSVVSRKLRWYEFTAKRWKRNWEGYFSATTDSVMYNNQSIERDAQKYSIKFLKKHKHRYKKEEDWVNTFNAVNYRYEQADLDARKEYGLFYKFKIENNIRNKSREDDF